MAPVSNIPAPESSPDSSAVPKNQSQTVKRPYYSREFLRAIHLRDGSRCAWVDAKTGRRCSSRYRVQIDHIIAFALGGPTTLANCRLACFHHNQRQAINTFGMKKMEPFILSR